jgi:hypothetical protein
LGKKDIWKIGSGVVVCYSIGILMRNLPKQKINIFDVQWNILPELRMTFGPVANVAKESASQWKI